MPKKKKPSKKSNGRATGAVPSPTRSPRQDLNDSVSTGYNDSAWTEMLDGLNQDQPEKEAISRRTLYDEYKRATISFKEGMASLVPSLGTNVHSLVEAADSLEKSDRKVSPNLLRTLRSAIRIRQRVALLYDDVGGQDPGHEYFVKVLQYCYQRLKPLAQSTAMRKGKPFVEVFDNDIAQLSNKFQALSTEHDDNESESEDDWEETNVERPEEPEVDYSIDDDLIDGSDFFLATAFLDTTNSLMGEVASSYANLKTICRQSQKTGDDKPVLGFELMKCAVVANAAIQELRYHEQVLVEERAYLNSFYRILAAALFHDTINSLVKEMKGTDTKAKRQAATEYIGDTLHLCGCNGDDIDYVNVLNESEGVWFENSFKFSKAWKLTLYEVMRLGSVVKHCLEIELGRKRHENLQDTWLLGMKHISGDRSIVQTLTSIDEFSTDSGFRGKKVMLEDADFGWNSSALQDCSTRALKKWFVWPLLAELLYKAGFAPSAAQVVYSDELLPMHPIFHNFCSPEQAGLPAPVLLVFTVQMMLTAVIELQGDGDLARLALAAKLSMARYHEGLEKALKLDAPFVPSALLDGIPQFLYSKRLLVDKDKWPVSATGTDKLALWNPCFAGMTILYTEIFQNLQLGGFSVNAANQVRSILHLSHALRKRDVVVPSHELLLLLESIYGDKVWAIQPLPEMGDFAKHFWLADGMCHSSAEKLARSTALAWLQDPDYVAYQRRRKEGINESIRLQAENVSKSYRCLVLSDFQSKNGDKEQKMNWLDLFRGRVAETLTKIDDEKSLHSHNLLYLGIDLCEFFRLLSDVLNLDTGDVSSSCMTSLFLSTLDLTVAELTGNPNDRRIDSLLQCWNEFFSPDRTLRKYEFLV